ncbi:MAG: hypothetical protein CM15mP120_06220 [Pseudomonadota bacterium]|nr:MAG: hypothetical protein CM15mP120_06220 [Pseudomonadota bacterium]
MRAFDVNKACYGQYSPKQFKSGLKLMLKGGPFTILKNEFEKTGKGRAFKWG